MTSSIIHVFGEDITDYLEIASVKAWGWPDVHIIRLLHLPTGIHGELDQHLIHSVDDFKRYIGEFLDRAIRHRSAA